MKVICIDAGNGWLDNMPPPFSEGEIIEVVPISDISYYDKTYNSGIWNRKRFVPISSIDETTFERFKMPEHSYDYE